MPKTHLRSVGSGLLLGLLFLLLPACVGAPPDVRPPFDGDGGTNGGTDGGTNGGSDGGATLTCGDRTIQAGEACDDGNTAGSDGCAADCKTVESGWFCDTAGTPCVRNVCGDGRTVVGEDCDDRNTTSNDGCSAQCTSEAGWTCPPGGGRCVATRCGDNFVAGDEECEDGDSPPTGGDGCSATCRLERGYKCPTAGQACVATPCGDGTVEGTEQCEDGNNDMGDGCSPLCLNEPQCTNGTCVAVCGDGVILPGTTEECDDGNLRANDGCSPTCVLEPGFQCQIIEQAPPDSVEIPVVYRDFRGNDLAGGHVDFENGNNTEKGIVGALFTGTLGTDGKPVYAKGTNGSGSATTHGRAAFDQWYRDTPNVNKTVVSTLVLPKQANGSYLYDNRTSSRWTGWAGWPRARRTRATGATTSPSPARRATGSSTRAPRCSSSAGTMTSGSSSTGAWRWIWAVSTRRRMAPSRSHSGPRSWGSRWARSTRRWCSRRSATPRQSSYKLTLTNFVTRRTECVNTCGDGVVQPPEQCDNGTNAGGYGQCAPGCILGPRCGDGVIQ